MNKKNIFQATVAIGALAILASLSPLPVRAATTLYADISATPNSGSAPLNGVDLTAVVSGDATGNVIYRFDCTTDGVWDLTQTLNSSTYTAVNLCNYPSAGNYTATIKVERENLAFQGTLAILVQAPTAPTVDLKINGSDGTINVPYNTSAVLSWTSTNASYCSATGNWSGNKSLSGSEGTGTLLSSATYTITCTGSGGSASDTVAVIVNSQATLGVVLEAIPNYGTAPLNGVDLMATVSGTASGTINYRFDCTSDGTWDYIFNSITDNPKTVVDACNYANPGTYTAKVIAERGAGTAQATAQVVATLTSSGSQNVSVSKNGRNLSAGTDFTETVAAKPGEVVQFKIVITSTGNALSNNLFVRDALPDKMSYYGSLALDNVLVSGDILSGISIGSLAPQQTKTITFQALVAPSANFSPGAIDLINTAIVYNDTLARTDTAKVQVTKTAVLGATDVPTGVFDNAKTAFLLSLLATFALTYFLLLKSYLRNKVYAWGIDQALENLKKRTSELLFKKEDPQEKLNKLVEEFRKKENL